jgi:hypothetical protein
MKMISKEEFQKERDKAAKILPHSVKMLYGEIRFCKYGPDYVGPVLIMDPCDIDSPDGVGEQWLKQFRKVSVVHLNAPLETTYVLTEFSCQNVMESRSTAVQEN